MTKKELTKLVNDLTAAQHEDHALLRRTQDALKRERDANEWRRLVSALYKRAEDHDRNCPNMQLSGLMLEDLKNTRLETSLQPFNLGRENAGIPLVFVPGSVTPTGIVMTEKMTPPKLEGLRRLSLGARIKKQFKSVLDRARKAQP